MGQFVARRAHKYIGTKGLQIPLLLGLIWLLLALMWPRTFDPWFDRHIEKIRIEGNQFRTVNRDGHTIWTSPKQSGMMRVEAHEDTLSEKQYYVTFDANDNGKEELLFTPYIWNKQGRLQFYDEDGVLIWDSLGYDTCQMATQIESISNSCLNLLLLDHRSGRYVITETWLLSEPLCWQQFCVVNQNGRVSGPYTYPGVAHLVETISLIIDHDNDGEVELVVAGTNVNSLRSGMAILDLWNLSGMAPPYNENFVKSGLQKGSQKYYVSFPETPLCDDPNVKNDIYFLRYDDTSRKFSVHVTEGINLLVDGKQLKAGNDYPVVLYELDENLIPYRIRLTDQSEPLYQKYWKESGRTELIDFDRLYDSLESEVIVYYGDSIVHHLAAGIDFYSHH